MIKKNILVQIGGYQGGRLAQDYDLWLRLMRQKKLKFYNIQKSLVGYRLHEKQTKGTKAPYGYVSSYLFREALFAKSLRYFIGSLIYVGKFFFK